MNATLPARRILVVDDDPHLLNLLDMRLAEQGFEVMLASSAQEALDKVAEQKPDIVIADIMMPGMDGYELCGRIREAEELRNIPFVFLSALADTEDKVKGLRLGADDYITKPFEFHELLARIEILLDRYQRYKETFAGSAEIATSGRIEDLGVIDLLQMLSFGQKTGEVRLESGSEHGTLYLMSGRLIAATYRNKEGAAALPVLLSWSEGRFSVKLTDSLAVLPTIQHQTDEAIFEALRELDEVERIKQELDAESVPTVAVTREPTDELERIITGLADGGRNIQEILRETSAADLAVLKRLRELANEGVVELRPAPKPVTPEPAEVEPRVETEPRVVNLMVIGTDRQARNTFIRAVSGEENLKEETVLNFGRVTKGPHQFNLYGLPGAKRFAPLWQLFVRKVQGMILITSPSDADDLDNLRFALSLLRPRVHGPTLVINADPTQPEPKLDTEGIKVITCLPSDRTKAEEIFSGLAQELLR